MSPRFIWLLLEKRHCVVIIIKVIHPFLTERTSLPVYLSLEINLWECLKLNSGKYFARKNQKKSSKTPEKCVNFWRPRLTSLCHEVGSWPRVHVMLGAWVWPAVIILHKNNSFTFITSAVAHCSFGSSLFFIGMVSFRRKWNWFSSFWDKPVVNIPMETRWWSYSEGPWCFRNDVDHIYLEWFWCTHRIALEVQFGVSRYSMVTSDHFHRMLKHFCAIYGGYSPC